MARQYFYLVATDYDECTFPKKIFLQEHEAIQWGRRMATKQLKETGDFNYQYVLYKQEITRSGELIRVKTLLPYKDQLPPLGSDYDIDKYRAEHGI